MDLNRAGTPLLEIVTEPDFDSPEAGGRSSARSCRSSCSTWASPKAQMQMGHMRFEPNINVHITDEDGNVHKTAITEIKNLNSFNVLERATAYEVARQIAHWEQTPDPKPPWARRAPTAGTRPRQATYWQRDKEQEQDYRYFPDPDLVPVEVDDAWLAELKGQIGELPAARRKRYAELLGGDARRRAGGGRAGGRPGGGRLLRRRPGRRRRAQAGRRR